MTDDEWVKVAMVEDSVVAEFLTSLKDTNKTTAPPSTSAPAKPALSFEWRVRQRRSKGVSVVPTKKQKTSTTASPTTPLSWSGATSISGCAGGTGGCRGFEVEDESSKLSAPKITDMTRSKVSGSCEVSTAKKCRKKKTLTQLREEEVLLERERRQLKRELESIRDNLEHERTRNKNFKRMKQQAVPFKLISMTMPPIVVSNHGHGLIHQSSQNGCREGKMETGASKFELPDLNLPLEENPCDL